MLFKYNRLLVLLFITALFGVSFANANTYVVFSNLGDTHLFTIVGDSPHAGNVSVNNAVSDIMEEGETKQFTIGGTTYEVNVLIVSDTSSIVKVKINGEISDALRGYEVDFLSNGAIFGVRQILPNEAEEVTGGDLVRFYLGSSVTVQPTSCGNNICELGEDANSCSADCSPICGNNLLETDEECDDGNTDTMDGCIDCKLAVCGDDYLYYLWLHRGGTETCEPNRDNDPFCRLPGTLNECTKCGDFAVQSNEQCDDGGLCTGDNATVCNSNGDCALRGLGICAPRDGDRCSATCQKEVAGCGNNICDENETCEQDSCCNGNSVNFDIDSNNCGGCGIKAGEHEICIDGNIVPDCGDNYCIENETCEEDSCIDGVKFPVKSNEVRYIEPEQLSEEELQELKEMMLYMEAMFENYESYEKIQNNFISFNTKLEEGTLFRGFEFNDSKMFIEILNCDISVKEEDYDYYVDKVVEAKEAECSLFIMNQYSEEPLFLYGKIPLSTKEVGYLLNIGNDYLIKLENIAINTRYCYEEDFSCDFFIVDNFTMSILKNQIELLIENASETEEDGEVENQTSEQTDDPDSLETTEQETPPQASETQNNNSNDNQPEEQVNTPPPANTSSGGGGGGGSYYRAMKRNSLSEQQKPAEPLFECGWFGYQEQCGPDERCENNKCVTYCGNSICESNEDCESCSRDCICGENSECYNSQCVEYECGIDSDCDDNNPCTLDSCVHKSPKKCVNEQIKEGCNVDGECIEVGTQIEDLYCSKYKVPASQKMENITCTYDYECSTNHCLNNACQSSSFVKRAFNWCKNLFWFW